MIIILITVIIGIIIIAIVTGKQKGNEDTEAGDKKIELEKTSSTIRFSDDFKSGEPIIKKDLNHTITTILVNKEDRFVWICPCCETENPLSKSKCCLCHYTKVKEGEGCVL